ncbi:MAG: hypothetical protein AB1714_22570 [Acidobacteriota bacterium]
MKRCILLLVPFLALSSAEAMSLLDWFDSIGGSLAEGRAPWVLLQPPLQKPPLVYCLEPMTSADLPPAGTYVFRFGEIEEARVVEGQDTKTGVPYLLLVSTTLPRRVFAAQPLMLKAEARVLVVAENLAVTPDPRVLAVSDISPGELSNRNFTILDGAGVRTARDIGREELFQRPASQTDEYLALPGTLGFPLQMAYYHLTETRRRLAAWGIRVPAAQADVYVNLAGMQRGLYQRRAPLVLAFGENQASDADILVHEYGHAVADNVNAHLMIEGESQFAAAIHEAYGDFLASAMAGNPRIGEWGGRPMRMIQNRARYPNGCIDPKLGRFDPYTASRVVSGLFYDIAKKAGARPAAGLFTDAVRRLPPSPTFADLRIATIEAARPLGLDGVADLFTARGIGPGWQGNELSYLVGEKLTVRDDKGREAERFDRRSQIEVVVEGEARSVRPGYNLVSDLELAGPPGLENSAVLFNGRWPAADGQVVAPLGHIVLRDAPPGSYQVRVRVKIGGNPRVYYLFRNFTVA